MLSDGSPESLDLCNQRRLFPALNILVHAQLQLCRRLLQNSLKSLLDRYAQRFRPLLPSPAGPEYVKPTSYKPSAQNGGRIILPSVYLRRGTTMGILALAPQRLVCTRVYILHRNHEPFSIPFLANHRHETETRFTFRAVGILVALSRPAVTHNRNVRAQEGYVSIEPRVNNLLKRSAPNRGHRVRERS
jgi:hypothetical protein